MNGNFTATVRGRGPGLLLAHGAGGSVDANFGPVLDDLARTHTVIGADYPGSGATPRSTEPLDLDDVADELAAIAVDAGVERWTVLGYSLGTAVAVRLATRHPDRVDGLILTAGFAKPDNTLRLTLEIWDELLRGDHRLLATFLTLVASGRGALEGLAPSELGRRVDDLATSIPAGSPEHVALCAAVDTRAELRDIRVPTLVVSTTADRLTGPPLSRELADGIPHADLVEIDAGHLIGDEAPGAWLAAIQRFLSGKKAAA
ncbi:Pimeloyl-ACP methyl ester carboxylesterase [Prauserella aidingensis]|uniref:alpha/beta fold hydrolase n=1 Tax=Prauserella aidingensis TaxID=387890 RepID=UPI0020A5AC17|nr:alpha/beta hydrolase [Prauserella aidingensis]MCP2254101.1 Pimeloyl-ACP methyl ester carboxylesterase [Prauserella aidingensis]